MPDEGILWSSRGIRPLAKAGAPSSRQICAATANIPAPPAASLLTMSRVFNTSIGWVTSIAAAPALAPQNASCQTGDGSLPAPRRSRRRSAS